MTTLRIEPAKRVVSAEAISDLRKLADDLESGKASAVGLVRLAPGGDIQVRFSGLETAGDALQMIGGLEHLKADIMSCQRG